MKIFNIFIIFIALAADSSESKISENCKDFIIRIIFQKDHLQMNNVGTFNGKRKLIFSSLKEKVLQRITDTSNIIFKIHC